MNISIILVAVFFTAVSAHPYKDNVMREIEEINRAQSSWKAEYNEISALSNAERKKLLGADIPPKTHTLRRKLAEPRDDIPASFDAREQWSECPSISAIKDQGGTENCWAVSTASAASDRLCIASNYNIKVNLSALNLMTCCTDCSNIDGCNVGKPLKAWEHIQNSGIVTGGDYNSGEGCQPYTIIPRVAYEDECPSCQSACTNSDYNISYNEDLYYGSSTYLLNEDVSQIQTDLMNNGPSVVTFKLYEDFYKYKTGVYWNTTDASNGYHCVKLIGWGTDKDSGLDYWLAANSWGSSWGENGLFKIRRGTNNGEFEQYITAGLMSA